MTRLGYKGAIAVHCEKNSLLRPDLWDSSNPFTHVLARPKNSEIEGVKDQIRFIEETGFKGRVHIVHVSCPESVDLVIEAKQRFPITCGVTPHHVMWNNSKMRGREGLIYKMNPPLASKKDVEKLRELEMELF